MEHGTEQHLEHAEHAQHAAHDPFNKRVALTMAIIAAVLAAFSMLSHRAHNDTLLYKGEETKFHARASDQWNYYQAKKQRGYGKEDFAEAARYSEYLADTHEPEEATTKVTAGAAPKDGHGGSKTGNAKPEQKKQKLKPPKDPAGLPAYWKASAALYQKEAEEIFDKAKGLEDKAHEEGEKSHHAHEKAARLDLGHLGLEMALVLCSIALLARERSFWFAGIVVSVIGTAICLSAYLL
jgi:hypothetical protein